tara:strand:+ start:753 stop:1040 length:288 start_codon:yes stop_codon:yes gene_type:complete
LAETSKGRKQELENIFSGFKLLSSKNQGLFLIFSGSGEISVFSWAENLHPTGTELGINYLRVCYRLEQLLEKKLNPLARDPIKDYLQSENETGKK